MDEPVIVDRDPLAWTITLARPDRRNPLSTEVLDLLGAAIEEAGTSDAAAIVLAATGPVWCTGHDLREMAGLDGAGVRGLFTSSARVMRAIEQSPQVVVAKVHALATAAGCQLVASCDLAVASASARFAAPGGQGGLFCHTPMVAIARDIGRKRAMELALSGDAIDAATALDWGLVNLVVPDDDLDAATDAFVGRVTRGSRASKALGKQTLRRQLDLPLDAAYALATDVMVANASSGDGAEAVAAFAEKRAPTYRHRARRIDETDVD